MSTRRKFLETAMLAGVGGMISSGLGPVYLGNLQSNKGTVPLQEAQQLHKECMIFDSHNDTPVERVARGENVSTMLQLDEDYHTDLPRMKTTGYDGASFIVGNGRIANVWVTLEQTLSMVEANPDKMLLVNSSDDLVRAQETGKLGILPSIEGIAKWVMGEADILRMLYRNGVRWVSITHGEGGLGPELEETGNPLYKDMRKGPMYLQGTPSPYTYCTPQERRAELRNSIGLTTFGEEILDLSNELGIVTDLAHINDRAYYDVLERTEKPAVISHTAVFSLCNHFRNVTDDQIKALAKNGGVMGVCFVRHFLSKDAEKATLQTLVEHIAYVADLVGIEYVGIGTDFDGITNPLVSDVSQLVKVTKSMMEHGFSDSEIKKIWGGNFRRVLKNNIG